MFLYTGAEKGNAGTLAQAMGLGTALHADAPGVCTARARALLAYHDLALVHLSAGNRLVDAPELVPSPASPEVFFFHEPGDALQLLRTFFLDPGLVLTKRLKDWISQLRQRHIGFNRFGDDAALSLFLSGAPKTASRCSSPR